MGTYSPAPFLSDSELEQVGEQILRPWLAGCAADGIDFRGLLYPGVMLTASGPKVIEFNARFGDPETQVYLPRLENDLVDLLIASATGTLDRITLRWSSQACVCVVAASGGYPGPITKDKVIEGLDAAAALPDVKVFHAGTAMKNGKIVTSGGRVLGITAWVPTLAEARDRAYAALGKIHFEGMHYRTDIGAKALAR
jgi:phosphoribosylamine--glycine ligase